MNFAEFYLMVSAKSFQTYLKDGDLEKTTHHCRVLRHGFDLAAMQHEGPNTDGVLTAENVGLALNALHSGTLSVANQTRIWKLIDPNSQGAVGFVDFLRGMEAAMEDRNFAKLFGVGLGHNFLLSMIVDAPVSKVEQKRIYSSFSMLGTKPC